MSRFIFVFVCLVGLVILFVASKGIAAENSIERLPCGIDADKVIDRGLIVRFKHGIRAASALSPYRSISWNKERDEKYIKSLGWGFTVVRVDEGVSLSEVFEMLSNDPLVKDVWPDVERTPSYIPNDPLYFATRIEGLLTPDRQYYLELIGAPSAWDVTTGSEAVVVANIDTGAELTHEDLVTQLWENSGEIPDNSIDDDGNGYIDDFNGYDFYFGDGNPNDDLDFTVYHGTSTSGIIGARGGNNLGIMGVAGGRSAIAERGVRLMILRVGTDTTIKLSAEIEAIGYAIDNGAHIINMSFGGESGGAPERDACDAAWQNGLLVIAAAGNEGAGAAFGVDYPAAFESVIAIGATTIYPSRYPNVNTAILDESWADYSKKGAEIELSAPGTALITITGGNSYTSTGNKSFTGTSGSSPIVAGLAALILSANPDLTNSEVRTLMQDTSVDMGLAGRDELYGYGRVDFEAALTGAGESVAGDTNADGVVNSDDIPEIHRLFGVRIGDPKYEGRVDCNRDGVIDELDLFPIGNNYGLVIE